MPPASLLSLSSSRPWALFSRVAICITHRSHPRARSSRIDPPNRYTNRGHRGAGNCESSTRHHHSISVPTRRLSVVLGIQPRYRYDRSPSWDTRPIAPRENGNYVRGYICFFGFPCSRPTSRILPRTTLSNDLSRMMYESFCLYHAPHVVSDFGHLTYRVVSTDSFVRDSIVVRVISVYLYLVVRARLYLSGNFKNVHISYPKRALWYLKRVDQISDG